MKILISLLFVFVSLFSKEITIESEDGFKLHGWLEYPKEQKESYALAVFAHQFGADHKIWNETIKDLHSKGFATLNLDLRGHGKSIIQNNKENKIVNDTSMQNIKKAIKKSAKQVKFQNITSDLVLWLDFISDNEELDMENLVLFGSSLGAAAILPLALDYEPKVIIAISPGSGDKDAIKDSISVADTAILFISGKNDPLKANIRAQNFNAQAMRGTNITISNSGHGTVLLPFVKDYINLFIQNNLE